MRNADAIRRRIDEIKEMSESDQSKALTMLAEVSFDIGVTACEERKSLKQEVDRLRKLIVGNGDPSNSIMARLKGLEDSVNKLSCSVGEDIIKIKNALLGNINGNEKGLVDRVADNTRITHNLNRIVWAVVLIIVGELVARLIGLF